MGIDTHNKKVGEDSIVDCWTLLQLIMGLFIRFLKVMKNMDGMGF